VWTKFLDRYPASIRWHDSDLDGTSYRFSIVEQGLGTLNGPARWQHAVPPLAGIGMDLVAFGCQDTKGKTMTEEQLVQRLRKVEAEILRN
jgi:hypothetical protein